MPSRNVIFEDLTPSERDALLALSTGKEPADQLAVLNLCSSDPPILNRSDRAITAKGRELAAQIKNPTPGSK